MQLAMITKSILPQTKVMTDIQIEFIDCRNMLRECENMLRNNETLFNLETNEIMIDSRIYERECLLAKHRYLISRIRELNKTGG